MKEKTKATKEELKIHHCFEPVDRVAHDSDTTAFKRQARLYQALWRESRSIPEGTQPMRIKEGRKIRPLGSRIDTEYSYESGVNFLSKAALEAVRYRVAHPEPKQMLDVDRLYADLLSSMPMCFNLFGPLWADTNLATKVVKAWWPDAPGVVRATRFEWSPGRQIPGRFLENRSAFDVAFEMQLEDGSLGLIGVETKYHEDCKTEKAPSNKRIHRYEEVAHNSAVFQNGVIDSIIGTRLQQIWLDHLLALSLLQDSIGNWKWVKFVLVYPAENPSFARASEDYASLLVDSSTYGVRTIESLLENPHLPEDLVTSIRERYLW